MEYFTAAFMQLPETFWPSSAVAWLTLIGLLAGGAAGVWKITKVMHDINGLGERMNDHDERTASLEGRQTKMEQDAKFSELDRQGMRESIGRLSTEVSTLAQLVRASQGEDREAQSEIRERLVRIETLVERKTGGTP